VTDTALADVIVGRLLALPMADPLQPTAEVLAARRTAIRIAEARQLDDRLLQAARDKSPAVRVALATLIYRHWLRHREDGWRLIEALAAEMLGPLSLPRAGVLEAFGHASLAILNNHQDQPVAMARLLGIWRGTVEKLMRGPVVRVIGQRWSLRIMLVPLVELMKRQPAYQPLNAREMAVTFARGDAFRRNWQLALDLLDHPERSLKGLAATLCQKDMPFDVYLMLVSERALIVAGARDQDAAFAVLERLFHDGVSWFRQSVLYVLFHVLGRAKAVDDERLARYGAMTEAFFAQDGAVMTTEVASYAFAPHLAWPEIVHDSHRPGSGPWLLPRLLQQALDAGDKERAERVFKAIDLAGFAYGRRTLALALIEKAATIGGTAVDDRIVEALANVRFEDEALVDEFLETPAFAKLKAAVRAASPTIRGEDIPTWIDGFVVQSMLTSDAFRRQVCDAFRRALTARSTSEFLMQILVWVVNLLAGRRVVGPAA
jgi:alkylhydroperoxidase family enzyme